MDRFYIYIIPLLIGFLLDSLLGDPHRLPHPIRFFGNCISFADRRFNKGEHKKLKGLLSAAILIVLTWLTLWGATYALLQKSMTLYYVFASVMFFYGISNRSLISEALKVEKSLLADDIEKARLNLSYIVGRDTAQLSAQKIRVATLETLAENLSDGIIAPVFYYAIGGIPLMFAYKMANTLDSMIGYKNEKYKDFGWFAARFDDVANFIPARITAMLMVLASCSARGLFFIFRYGHKHASPNAGYPEAALAGILDCRFGGPNLYHGILVEKPYIGSNNRAVTHTDFIKSCRINILSVLLMLAGTTLLLCLI